ncbi:CheR family methyltransferase [Ramlibacter sp.]|uniref:CheR family methyltransferase n=1 Tax=Ramlibacter sp. TaxID=1917967 RepID=UPI002D576975|nr:CheR family methyltransferase [Ramlibacter sp.]HYD75533.1 CheR family methyltransferase [Ramlibacter sp.]
MADTAATLPWAGVSRRLESRLGLHFGPRRWPDLERGLASAAARLGLADAQACADAILSSRLADGGWQVVAECLAVGETYFFRDPQVFDDLATHVLRPLVAARRDGSRHLRLWSAACSTGEEAWSLAMLVASLLPDWREWNISILATDLNASALRKARAGRYGRWSIRSGVPPLAREWLRPGADGGAEVAPELRPLVRFARLNLAGDGYPSATSQTLSMDLVLCRNVLIYFEPARARAVLERLGAALVPGGWLVTGPVELPRPGLPGLEPEITGGLTALRRSGSASRESASPEHAQPSKPARPLSVSPRIQRAPHPRPAVSTATPLAPEAPAPTPAIPMVLQARGHADAGDLARAEQLCRLAIEQDKLDPQATHLLATILHERGAIDEAMAALQRTLYLDPDHVLARFTLGSLALRQGETQAGRRHLAHARSRLARCAPDHPLEGSGGLTAGELEGVIRNTEAGT